MISSFSIQNTGGGGEGAPLGPSLAYHAIVANHVVPPGIFPGFIQNRPGFPSCYRHLRLSVEDVNIVCVDNSGF